MTISSWILLIMRTILDKLQRKWKKFLCSISLFSRKSRRVWDNVEKYGRARQATDDNIIRRLRFAFWMTKATDTHSEYVIIIAFPQHQWLRERATMLRYTYIACIVGLFTDLSLVSVFASSLSQRYTRRRDCELLHKFLVGKVVLAVWESLDLRYGMSDAGHDESSGMVSSSVRSFYVNTWMRLPEVWHDCYKYSRTRL
jgi:hypothetical protein